MARHQRKLVEEADVILLVGNRTNQNGTDSWTPAAAFAPDSSIIDIDGGEIGRNYESLRLVGDAKLTLAALTAAPAAPAIWPSAAAARPALERRIAEGRQRHRPEAAAFAPIAPRSPSAGASDGRSGRGAAGRRHRRRRRQLRLDLDDQLSDLPARRACGSWPRGVSPGLGWGLPMALGAKLAAPDRRVFCLVGDGGFAHVWSELETARRHRHPVMVTVLNNQILGYQKHAEDVLFGAHTSAVDFSRSTMRRSRGPAGCEACGSRIPAITRAALAEAARRGQTTVIDVIVDPDAYPPITSFEGKRPTSQNLEESGA